MTIMITLQQIKDANPCEGGWKKVLKANGGSRADISKPFPLVSILDSNDLEDALWVISNVSEMREYDDVWRKFASFCALQNIEKIAKYCSSQDYELIVNWLKTNNTDLRQSAWSAAWSAARSAESAESAAWSAAWSAWSAESAQEEKLRELIS